MSDLKKEPTEARKDWVGEYWLVWVPLSAKILAGENTKTATIMAVNKKYLKR